MDIIDNVDENPTADCTHDSGTSFPVGTTDVSCIVSDFSNNTNECDFSIVVQGRIVYVVDSTVDRSLSIG